jgi:hypothetical protein
MLVFFACFFDEFKALIWECFLSPLQRKDHTFKGKKIFKSKADGTNRVPTQSEGAYLL